MAKTKIIVDGREIEIDFDTMSKEEAEKYNISFNDKKAQSYKNFRIKKWEGKITGAISIATVMAYLLLGFLSENFNGWTWGLLVFFAIPFTSFLFSFRRLTKNKIAVKIITMLTFGAIITISIIVPGGIKWSWVLILIIPISTTLLC